MQKTKSFPVSDEKEIRAFVEQFTANEYHKKSILATLEHAKTLAEYASTLYLEITFEELDGKLYHEHSRIFADGFTFNFMEYRGEWSFYVEGHNDTLKKKYEYAPDLANYKLPKVLKKWSQKKYDSAIEYLKQYRENLYKGEEEKRSQLHSRAQVEEEVKRALKTENMHRTDGETEIWNEIATVKVYGSGQMTIRLNEYKIENKIAFLEAISGLDTKNN